MRETYPGICKQGKKTWSLVTLFDLSYLGYVRPYVYKFALSATAIYGGASIF